MHETCLRNLLSFRWPPRLAIAICFLAGTLLPAAFGLVVGIPEPQVHDEFSFLLAGDTFAHGRLTNPTPESPEFFEAEHILVVPSYMSKYPPGQGLVLAAGQVLCGHPIWGVWLSCGCFAASLCWMLQAWTSPRWAIVTSLFAIIGFGISSYWAQSYWGGMPAACGGALLFGGMRRTLRHARISSSLLMAAGVVVLAATRPFEGVLACLPAGLLLCRWLVADTTVSLSQKLIRWLVPFTALVAAGGWANGTYNRAVTGDALRLPYTIHLRQYFHQGVFKFSEQYTPEREPHERLARFYAEQRFTPVRRVGRLMFKVLGCVSEALQRLLSSVLVDMTFNAESGKSSLLWIGILLVVGLRSRWGWFCAGTLLFVILGQSFVEYWHAHYAAPVVPLVLAVMAEAIRRVCLSIPRYRGTALVTPAALAILAGCLLSANYGTVALVGLFKLLRHDNATTTVARPETNRVASRQDVIQRLGYQRGVHLVFVRYEKSYSLEREWVYNEADLATARVLFVHDFDDAKNRELMARYPARSVWLCTVSRKLCELRPYPGPNPGQAVEGGVPLKTEGLR